MVNFANEEVETIMHDLEILFEKVKEERRINGNIVSPSIFEVHSSLRSSSFDPRAIAIGPLHKNVEKLKANEHHKAAYQIYLFGRLPTPLQQTTMTECVQKVHAELPRIRACYEGKMERYSNDEVAEMMVLDSCFILEFNWRLMSGMWPQGDTIFGNKSLCNIIVYDLILLENQIPFFVLQDIFKYTILKIDPAVSLTKLFRSFFICLNHFDAPLATIQEEEGTQYDHILGLFHKHYKPLETTPSRLQFSKFHTAMDLSRAGIKIKKNEDEKWVLAMEFKASRGQAILSIPALKIQDNTERVLRNLIAYEQCSSGIQDYITSYVVVMDCLVDTKEDVLKMVKSQVIINQLDNNEDAANIINSLCKEVHQSEFYYGEEWQKLDSYYNGFWPRNMGWLRCTFFSNPWNLIGLLVVIMFLALVTTRTYFIVFPRH